MILTANAESRRNSYSRSRVGSGRRLQRPGRGRPVSIHAPAWGAKTETYSKAEVDGFQFTLPRGERQHDREAMNRILQVSIHAPAWGATRRRLLPRRRPARFNSRSRVGSDITIFCPTLLVTVSIHAPAWGATRFADQAPGLEAVSIHAPAWGATEDDAWNKQLLAVSIHAPAWGATRSRRLAPPAAGFQFTLPRGERRHRRVSH